MAKSIKIGDVFSVKLGIWRKAHRRYLDLIKK